MQCNNLTVFRSTITLWSPVHVAKWYYNLFVKSAILRARKKYRNTFIVKAEAVLRRKVKRLFKSMSTPKVFKYFSKKALVTRTAFFKVILYQKYCLIIWHMRITLIIKHFIIWMYAWWFSKIEQFADPFKSTFSNPGSPWKDVTLSLSVPF